MIDTIQGAAVGLALFAFVALVAMPIVLLVHDLTTAPRPAGGGHGRASGGPGPAGVPAPREPVPPTLGASAAAVP